MRNIIRFALLSCLMGFAVCSCSPLRIVMNSKGKDGARTILTSNKHLFDSERGSFDVALGSKVSPKDTVLAILLTADTSDDHGIFDAGDRMLIRFEDQSEIVLKNHYDKEFDSHTETSTSTTPHYYNLGYEYIYSPYTGNVYVNPLELSAMVTETRSYKVNNSYALYLVSKKQMNDLVTKEVVELRVETQDAEYDMPYTGGVSPLFSEMYQYLHGYMKNPVRRSSF